MKIVYDHQIFSRQAHGGVSRYFQELANRMPALGAEAALIFAPLHINEYGRLPGANAPAGLRVPKLPGTVLASRVVNTLAGNLVVRPRRNVDVFHQTYYATSSYAPRTARRIVTVYDMIHELFPGSFPPGDPTSRLKRVSIARADHVICISETTRRDLIRFTGVAEEKTSVVHLGHSLATGAGTVAAKAVERPYLLYVGKREGHKNFDRLLSAYASSGKLRRDFDLMCFGGGGPAPGEADMIGRLGLTGRVAFSGGDDHELSALYSGASAFVYPSLYEGFGIPPLEAMAHDCPVVCSNAGSIPEVVGNAGRFFDPSDIDDMREAMEQVLYSDERRRRLAALGRARLRDFSWQKCARDTFDQYRRLTDGHA